MQYLHFPLSFSIVLYLYCPVILYCIGFNIEEQSEVGSQSQESTLECIAEFHGAQLSTLIPDEDSIYIERTNDCNGYNCRIGR